jgi:hypothetical protein
MIKTATQIASVVTSISNLITTNATYLGGIKAVLEKDEHPGVALESDQIPCAYVLPIVEGHMLTEFSIGHDQLRHEFPVTILMYYRADDVNSFIALNRNYAINLVDILNDNYNQQGYQIYKTDVTLGYWETSGDVVHFSITKCFGKLWF